MFFSIRDRPPDPNAVILKTKAYEPRWPRRCLVCNQSCDDPGKLIRVETGIHSVPVGRGFVVPLHGPPRDCRARFSRAYFWRVYSGYISGAICLGIFLTALYTVKVSGVGFFAFMLGLILVQTANFLFGYSKPIQLEIREVEGSDGWLEHEFRFAEGGYADEFRELNSRYLD